MCRVVSSDVVVTGVSGLRGHRVRLAPRADPPSHHAPDCRRSSNTPSGAPPSTGAGREYAESMPRHCSRGRAHLLTGACERRLRCDRFEGCDAIPQGSSAEGDTVTRPDGAKPKRDIDHPLLTRTERDMEGDAATLRLEATGALYDDVAAGAGGVCRVEVTKAFPAGLGPPARCGEGDLDRLARTGVTHLEHGAVDGRVAVAPRGRREHPVVHRRNREERCAPVFRAQTAATKAVGKAHDDERVMVVLTIQDLPGCQEMSLGVLPEPGGRGNETHFLHGVDLQDAAGR